MIPIAPHISEFLRERLPLQQGASIHTCDSYAYTFKLLFQFASERFKVTPSAIYLEQIDAQLIMDFLNYLEIKRHNKPRTRNARLVAIKSFMHFLEIRIPALLEQSRCILAIPAKKTDTRLIGYLSMEEMKAILDAPNLQTQHGIRDRAMIHLCFAAALRVSELVSLQLDSIKMQPTPSVHILGKGRKERALPLWKQTIVDIRAWLKIRGTCLTTELFLNARNQPMTRSGFEYILRKQVSIASKYCPSLLKKHISPHVLRHTAAMMVLQATGDIRKVSLWMGHSDIQSTEVYLRADPTEKLDAMGDIVPPNLKRGQYSAPDKLIAMLNQGT
jgi:integrase/recombinase XerD